MDALEPTLKAVVSLVYWLKASTALFDETGTLKKQGPLTMQYVLDFRKDKTSLGPSKNPENIMDTPSTLAQRNRRTCFHVISKNISTASRRSAHRKQISQIQFHRKHEHLVSAKNKNGDGAVYLETHHPFDEDSFIFQMAYK
ncbi:hypothetical protein Trydic_g23064 [Trypoxylus dichotomus]